MRFPSIVSLYSSVRAVARRFPLEVFFAFLGTIAGIGLIETSNLDARPAGILLRVLMASHAGLVLSLVVSFYSEAHETGGLKRAAFRSVAIVPVVLIFMFLDPLVRQADIFRYFLLAAAFHLFVSYSGFWPKKDVGAFWHFNKALFLRFLTGALYSLVLFLGLAAAIGSMNFLFGFAFEWDTYAILWIVIAGLFQTFFFLSGAPVHTVSPDMKSYPGGLKVFTQYVLIPLASVYVVILLAYEIKIILQWELPKGLVSNLIIWYAVFGILSLLLVYPVRNSDGDRWIRTYSKSFYYLLVPLLMLLFWAVFVRVKAYGITEERYLLIVLGCWLTFITGYFRLSSRENIVVIPLSLSLVTLLAVYGPQSAFEVSRRSQLSELTGLFERYGSVAGGKLQKLRTSPSNEDERRMLNIAGYLVNKHGLEAFREHLTIQPPDSLVDIRHPDKRMTTWEVRNQQEAWLYSHLNLDRNKLFTSTLSTSFYTIETDHPDHVETKGSDHLLYFTTGPDTLTTFIENRELKATYIEGQNKLWVFYKGKAHMIGMASFVSKLNKINSDPPKSSVTLPRELLAQSAVIDDLSLKIMWNRLTVAEGKRLTYGQAFILVTVREAP